MIPGMGAVATTLIAGVEAVRRGFAKPIGSITQMGTIRLGKRTDDRTPLIKDFAPIAPLDDLVFTGWDIFGGNLYDAAKTAGVLDRDQLESHAPLPRIHRAHARRLRPALRQAPHRPRRSKTGKNKCDLANQIRNDIAEFKTKTDRQVMIWCGSTEIFLEPKAVHRPRSLREGPRRRRPRHRPLHALRLGRLKEGIPFANGAPNLTVDIPALNELSRKMNAPICGKDFKTGQTFIKTVLAPAFKTRMLGVSGWYSTNILGNRDGEVLDDPESFKTKEESKLGVLEHIFQPERTPTSTRTSTTRSASTTTRPAATTKRAGTTSTSSAGSATRCRSRSTSSAATPSSPPRSRSTSASSWTSPPARPALRGLGIQEWLSFYFKDPDSAPGVYPEHDLFIQSMKLKNTLRHIMGEDLITHLGLDYYGE
jgi:myo-inositol-1-phosphate synthase